MSTFCEDLDLYVDTTDYNPEEDYLIMKIVDGRVIPDNKLVYEKHRRYYVEDLKKRDFSLENTTPYQIYLINTIIKETCWGDLLKKVTLCLLEKYPEKESSLQEFRCNWSKQTMFSSQKKSNHKSLKENIFINVNHSALHSCWFLQDLLEFFNVNLDNVKFIIHRPPSAEPKETKDSIKLSFTYSLGKYIKEDLGKDEEYVNKIVKLGNKYINELLKGISNSYTDLFLFDSYFVAYNYIKKLKEIVLNSSYDDKAKKGINTCLNILLKYYKKEKY